MKVLADHVVGLVAVLYQTAIYACQYYNTLPGLATFAASYLPLLSMFFGRPSLGANHFEYQARQ